jgi:ketosteroid isomerase-like protein
MSAVSVYSQTAPDAAELTKLLNDFLAGASVNDVAMHDRFWADDLIYTGSTGRRVSKADIMRDMRNAPAPKPDDPKTIFSAEEVRIQQYGNTAIVAFRLVVTTETAGTKQVAYLLNSGTFLKRDGKWQVVNWQATRKPKTEEENKRDVSAAESAFHQAVLAVDVKKVTSLSDPTFVWTHTDGQQMTREQLLEALTSGKLKYTKLETAKVTVAIYGETAIVRGETTRQRSSIPATPGTGDATPFTAFYTMTFINQGGAWRAVSMQTSRQK